jgi:hypothetical protein
MGGESGRKRGNAVRKSYEPTIKVVHVAAATTRTGWIGIKKATRPAKNIMREACSRRGIRSTTVCMRNAFNPEYRYENIFARMTGDTVPSFF